MSQFIKEKIKNKQITVKSTENVYRVLEPTDGGITAYYSACPIFRPDGSYIDTRFNKDGCFKGFNTTVQVKETEILLRSEKSNFTFALSTERRKELSENPEGTYFCRDFKNGVVFPTLNGFALETENSAEISFQTNEQMYFVNMEEYCLGFNHKDELIFSLNCICHNANTKADFITESDGVKHSAFVKAEGKITITINAYAPKAIFDTPLFREAEHFNHVYAETVSLTGGKREHWLLLRPDCEQFSDLTDYEVESARLYFRDFCGNGGEIQNGKLHFLWCAFTTTWESREIPQEWKADCHVRDGYFELDMTDYYRQLFKQKVKATPGFVLRAGSVAPIIIPTGDNYYEPIITELHLKESPKGSKEKEQHGRIIKTYRGLRV